MKKLSLAALMAVIAATILASAASAQPGNGKALGHSKQPVCHNGKTLFLPTPAVDAHVRHGDLPGECGGLTPLAEGDGDDGLVDLAGLTAPVENDGTDSASPDDTITTQGTLALKSGDPILKTSKGTLKLEAQSTKGEKRLESLAKKGERVKVTGKKSGRALEVSQLKSTKVKKK